MKSNTESHENLINKCPCCKKEGSLVLYVDAMDWDHEEGSDEWDSSVEFNLTEDLRVIKKRLPKNIETCDKDRYVKCTECGADSSYKSELYPHRLRVRELNPGWV